MGLPCTNCGVEWEPPTWRHKVCSDECRAEARSKYMDKDYRRSHRVKAIYGLDHDEYNEMYREQQGCCKICGIHEKDAPKGRLHVDHCHDTGEVRGLLCHHCNTGLGKFKDNIESLRAAVAYLES